MFLTFDFFICGEDVSRYHFWFTILKPFRFESVSEFRAFESQEFQLPVEAQSMSRNQHDGSAGIE